MSVCFYQCVSLTDTVDGAQLQFTLLQLCVCVCVCMSLYVISLGLRNVDVYIFCKLTASLLAVKLHGALTGSPQTPPYGPDPLTAFCSPALHLNSLSACRRGPVKETGGKCLNFC